MTKEFIYFSYYTDKQCIDLINKLKWKKCTLNRFRKALLKAEIKTNLNILKGELKMQTKTFKEIRQDFSKLMINTIYKNGEELYDLNFDDINYVKKFGTHLITRLIDYVDVCQHLFLYKTETEKLTLSILDIAEQFGNYNELNHMEITENIFNLMDTTISILIEIRDLKIEKEN